jgi:hypothetical protein
MFFSFSLLLIISVVTLETSSGGILFNDVVTGALLCAEFMPKQLEMIPSFWCLMVQAGAVISPVKRMVPEATRLLWPWAACRVAGRRTRRTKAMREEFIINSFLK